jgi:beta-galactosidase
MQEKDPSDLYRRYRLIWDEVPYEPGQIKVAAYDKNGDPAMERVIHTAGEPMHLHLETDKEKIRADGRDMVFVTVSVTDRNGYFCPKASNKIRIAVEGAAELVTIGSGDPTSLERYGTDHRKAFNGKCVAYIRSNGNRGTVRIHATSEELTEEVIELTAR